MFFSGFTSGETFTQKHAYQTSMCLLFLKGMMIFCFRYLGKRFTLKTPTFSEEWTDPFENT